MLVTACKQCGARFRVTPEQLNLRQGQVRCGQCHEVFSGFESLERFPGDNTGTRLLAARSGPRPDAARHLDDIDIGARLQQGESVPALPVLVPSPLPSPTSSTAPVAARQPRSIANLPEVPELLLESEVPASRPSRAWAFGVAFLLIVLGLQLAYAFRAVLAQQYAPLRPVLDSACATAGCTVPWINDESALKLEDSELLEVPGKPGQIALQARVRNLSSSAQEFPHLELTLTDLTGQTAVRRVLRPTDYLGRALVAGEVMAAGSEALLSVRLETGSIRPTGYELLLFYP